MTPFTRDGLLKGCLWILLLAAFLNSPPGIQAASITPERTITVLDQNDLPSWKVQWDLGREAAKSGDLQTAIPHYENLLKEKPFIEAAKWEYCQLLFELGRYIELRPYLQNLIEIDAYNIDYITMAGFVSLYGGEFHSAAQHLGEAYGMRPEGESGTRILEGYIAALTGLGKDQYALPLLEQLFLRKNEDRQVATTIAETALKLGLFDKAKDYYVVLLEEQPKSLPLLKNSAEAFLGAGDKEGAVSLWKRIVKQDPNALQFIEKIARYYQTTDYPENALPYLDRIIAIKPDFPPELLLITGRLYFYAAGRADKALRLYERYLENMPEHHEIRQEILKVREKITDDLLAIVENDGAANLWQDLQLLTEDPLLLFNMMADKLEKRKKRIAAIDVLKIIYIASEDKDDIALRISELYEKTGDSRESYKALLLVSDEPNRGAAYYRQKLEFERKLGMSREALKTAVTLLDRTPEDRELRLFVTELAGELGDYDILANAAEPLLQEISAEKYLKEYLILIRALGMVGAYLEAELLCDELLTTAWSKGGVEKLVLLELAELKHNQGLFFEEQEVYRLILNEWPTDKDILSNLHRAAVKDKRFPEADTLLVKIAGEGLSKAGENDYISQLAVIARAKATRFEYDGNLSGAADVLEQAAEVIGAHARSSKAKRLRLALDFEICRLFILLGKPDQCSRILEKYGDREGRVITIRFLNNIVENHGKLDVEDFIKQTREAHNSSGAVTSLFKAAEYARKIDRREEAVAILNEVLRREPGSARAMGELQKLYSELSRWQEALEVLQQLASLFPNDPFYTRRELEISLILGNYSSVVDATEFSGEAQDLPVLPRLIRARALWGDGREEDALTEYEDILKRRVNDSLQSALAGMSNGVTTDHEHGDGNLFWGLFYYDLSNRLDNLNAMNEKDGFLALAGTREGRLVADLYAEYRYERLVQSEFLARKAMAENRYVAAKKQYKRTIKESESPEALIDLAKVYERLGDYGKEAEIYTVLTEQGQRTAELEASIERNERVRAPTVGPEYLYTQKDGRDSAINIVREEGGLSFKFSPGVSSQVELLYHELSYSPVEETETVEGRLMKGRGVWEVIEGTSIDYDLGVHILDDEGDTTLLYDVRFEHRFEEYLKGYMVFGQHLVDDTLDSLRSGLDYRNIDVGFALDGENGFIVGTEFSRRSYSDDNNQNRMYFWTSYSLFSEFTTWTMKYSFTLQQNSIEGVEAIDEETGNSSYSLSYWSPESYSVHMARLDYTQLLKSFERFSATDSGYYTFGVRIGYESDENIVFGTEFDIFLEMSDHFLLKGDLSYEVSDDYDESRLSLSLMYRW